MERRLAAILLTDMVGYSRLMGLDEEGTIARQRTQQQEVFDPKISQFSGRIVKTTGDGLLVEFPSVVDAVKCAVDVQTELAARNVGLPDDRQIHYRIGINLGDIVIDGDDILGDGVNIAARLESIAEPGGICISGSAHEQLAGKVDTLFEDAGEQTVKNVPRPVQVWHWQPGKRPGSQYTRKGDAPDRPSFAVLPFTNLSGDPEQEFFADGMAEDIITSLSKFRWLLVIARNSSFSYKGEQTETKQVARELGVRYVLEGSVRSSGKRIRVTAQLVDAEAGNQIWADRYDRDLDDVFAIQDEITSSIVSTVEPAVNLAEIERLARKPPESFNAWERYQKGLSEYYKSTNESFQTAIDIFDTVNHLDPNFAPAFAMGAEARCRYIANWNPEQSAKILAVASEKCQQAVALDPRDSMCLAADARVRAWQGQTGVAIDKANEAIKLNPNHALAHHIRGCVLAMAQLPESALESFDEAIRLSPNSVFMAGFQMVRSMTLFQMQRYEEAVVWSRRSIHGSNPRAFAFAVLAASLCKQGRTDEARATVEDLLSRHPDFSISSMSHVAMNMVGERLADALRNIGLSD